MTSYSFVSFLQSILSQGELIKGAYLIGSLLCKIKGKAYLDFFSILMKSCHLWDRRAHGPESKAVITDLPMLQSVLQFHISILQFQQFGNNVLTFQPETNLFFFIKAKGLEIISLKECYMKNKQIVCWTSFSVGAEMSDAPVINMSLLWALY